MFLDEELIEDVINIVFATTLFFGIRFVIGYVVK
tara:strand:+ start:4465 stop:4566 length:102 start_codon:yes stop_codon:yes gene_type:complete